jgi:hypothetical protein
VDEKHVFIRLNNQPRIQGGLVCSWISFKDSVKSLSTICNFICIFFWVRESNAFINIFKVLLMKRVKEGKYSGYTLYFV